MPQVKEFFDSLSVELKRSLILGLRGENGQDEETVDREDISDVTKPKLGRWQHSGRILGTIAPSSANERRTKRSLAEAKGVSG